MRDTEFLRNRVPMTKEEVRAISLDKLNLAGQTLLDVGAGTGSVSLQAALEHPQLQVTAVERDPEAIEIMRQNMTQFRTTNIELIDGLAPEAIPNQLFDAIFVGGSGHQLPEIIEAASKQLVAGGRIVLNFILFENAKEAYELLHRSEFKDLEMVEAQMLRWHQLGPGHFFKPQNPTIIISATRKEQA